ncbi:MAG TPA: DUF2278 family protein [Roseiarcus sp.]|jgi:uncharacterized protein YukJ|nr:DUF2278 family protein [Roseiarcus sp.]
MGRINYNCLRGKVHAFAPAAPATNPHLWVLLEENGRQWFATINIRSDKDAPGDPVGKSYLYYLIDNDFRHPIVPTILARPTGLSPVDRDYSSGALDFQRGNLFDPRQMRVLPAEGDASDSLVHRLQANLQMARQVGADVFFYGNAFHKDNPHQTDAAFGYTPDTPFGLDNVHMTQGDPQAIDQRVHENGSWHDGACFIWDEQARRITAAFLAFQVQAWHTDDNGEPVAGLTGAEPPTYDFANGLGAPLPQQRRAAEITSAHRAPDRSGAAIVTNMTTAPLDLSGWSILADAQSSVALPTGSIGPGQTLSVALAPGVLVDEGGILTLRDPAGRRVDGVAYNGGDAARGWSTSFSTP